MSIVETFHGYIETTQDALLLLEACRRCLLPKIARRLHEKERELVRTGSVFVFDEKESGIKRWTDGLVWSPSRILGNFLIYHELEKPAHKRKSFATRPRSGVSSPVPTKSRIKDRYLAGSLSQTYNLKQDGLIKKTISLVVNGMSLHMVSYYQPEDIISRRLRTPSTIPELANLEIAPELLSRQNFRVPPTIEPSPQQQQLLQMASGGTGTETTAQPHSPRSTCKITDCTKTTYRHSYRAPCLPPVAFHHFSFGSEDSKPVFDPTTYALSGSPTTPDTPLPSPALHNAASGRPYFRIYNPASISYPIQSSEHVRDNAKYIDTVEQDHYCGSVMPYGTLRQPGSTAVRPIQEYSIKEEPSPWMQ
ncbi:hypothetical protein DFQ28_006065 [Apophysomyces sp. BC1034]|nr:hypothetical protein DFQ30_005735 [Apophysomyces sp. BC1015]KAG0177321.1 hypothetical protein DFQ29_004966 [Apophysomyces sp. BC1021]KAG0187621.1 hypothetical protein DFQ28_006065 [Apophysomyces sp. BC1034]